MTGTEDDRLEASILGDEDLGMPSPEEAFFHRFHGSDGPALGLGNYGMTVSSECRRTGIVPQL